MPPKNTAVITLCLAALLTCALLSAGCAGTPAGTPVATTESPSITAATAIPLQTAPASAGRVRTLRIGGSTTILPIVQKAAEQYMASHPDVDIQVSGGETGVAIPATGQNLLDIGMTSREVTGEEMTKYPSLVITRVARDGVAIIVNPANTIQNITLDQVRDIYTGKITRWSQIPGAGISYSSSIEVVGRDSVSGTRTFFDSFVLQNATPVNKMLEMTSNSAMIVSVAQDPSAIGYVSIGYLNENTKAVPIRVNNQTVVFPSVANVTTKIYPMCRDLYLVTNGPPSGLAGDFIRYLLSPEGQKIVADEGYVTLN
jgi:phosphate transport system substrate-binding protein